MSVERVLDLARTRFAILGKITAAAGVVLDIEPVPAFYGRDFLMGWRDILAMVNVVNSFGVKVHIDTGCVHPWRRFDRRCNRPFDADTRAFPSCATEFE